MLAFLAAPSASAAEDTAMLVGTLLRPDGRPAEGIRTVVEDVVSREEFLSTVSDARGEYTIRVAVGQRYRIVAAITPDGERIPIEGIAPIPVRVPGSYRLPDVLFVVPGETPEAPPPVAQPTTAPQPPTPSGTAVAPRPWYRRPAGMVGIGLGSVVVIAFATSGGGNGGPGSPAMP